MQGDEEMATPGKVYYSVGGKAPKGLKPGDIVVTEGRHVGNTGVNPDGTYKSSLVDPNINKSNYVPTREFGPCYESGASQRTDQQNGRWRSNSAGT